MDDTTLSALGVLGGLLAQFGGVSVAAMYGTEWLTRGAFPWVKRVVALLLALLFSTLVWAVDLVKIPDLAAKIAGRLTEGQRLLVELAVVAILGLLSTMIAGWAHDKLLAGRAPTPAGGGS